TVAVGARVGFRGIVPIDAKGDAGGRRVDDRGVVACGQPGCRRHQKKGTEPQDRLHRVAPAASTLRSRESSTVTAAAVSGSADSRQTDPMTRPHLALLGVLLLAACAPTAPAGLPDTVPPTARTT